jgi:hypothetical protein
MPRHHRERPLEKGRARPASSGRFDKQREHGVGGGVRVMVMAEAQMRRIKLYFPLSHGLPRVGDRRIVSGIIFVICNRA